MRTRLIVWWPALAALLALLVGGGLAVAGDERFADIVWGAAVGVTGIWLALEIVGQLRRREAGVDIVALLAMGGAIALGELLAGAIIAVMLTTGRALERYAEARARRELTALVEAAPRHAHRRDGDDLVDVAADEVEPGDVIVVRPGESVPVDGVLMSEHGVLDESTLTGESRPAELSRADRVASGAVNVGGPLELRATATAADSTYGGLVRLVEQAQAERAPMARLADRAAVVFVPVTLLVAGFAWALSGDPVRALAVLVVATPCPLILATPIAITSGISRLAHRGVIVKGGGALETLARAHTVLLDKTGTVTAGRPRVLDVDAFDRFDPDTVARLAASLDQVSAHVFAPALVQHARGRGLALSYPTGVSEQAGTGIEGMVDGLSVRVGHAGWAAEGPLPAAGRALKRRAAAEGVSAVFVSVDGRLIGAILLDDPLRADAVRTVRGFRRQGVTDVVLVTGDRADVASLIGAAIDVDHVLAERTPDEKVQAVIDARERGVVVMIGDGVNDAPALAHADVGMAMGSRGATASSEAADIVVMIDRFERTREALAIAQRTRRIAWQSIYVGMGAAFVAMGFAAFGYLTPVAGALVQEVIDVAAILVALRALGSRDLVKPAPELAELSAGMRHEHRLLQSGLDRLRSVADTLETTPPAESLPMLHSLQDFLSEELMPHELTEEHEIYPLLAKTARDEDPTGPLRHTHREIFRLVRLLDSAIAALPPSGPEPDDRPELRRLLYGLHAVMRMHVAQEEEAYGILDDGAVGAGVG
jgi:heavy metal translocating P-type ATPase